MVRKTSNISSLLIILGLLVFSLGLSISSATLTDSFSTWSDNQNYPYKITIKKIGLESKIIPGGLVNDKWILSDKYVLFLPSSGIPKEGFNTILYAHNKENLFSNLKNLQIGDEISLQDQKGKDYSYKVYLKEEVKAKEVFKLTSDVKNNLTLFTCDGIFDTKRLVVKAKII